MKLIPDWRRSLAFSLSFWLQVAGLAVLIAPEIRFAWTGQDSDPVFLWWLGVLLLLAGTAGRLLRQGNSPWREWLRIGAVVALTVVLALLAAHSARAQATEEETLAIAVPFIASWEGERLEAYIPVEGDVPTICFGSTRGVTLGMTKTHEECLELLRAEVAEYRARLHKFFTAETQQARLTPERDTGFTSLGFNAGPETIGLSTATRRLNAGDIAGGCVALTWWNKLGKRVLRGLVRRRDAEYRLCMVGV